MPLYDFKELETQDFLRLNSSEIESILVRATCV